MVLGSCLKRKQNVRERNSEKKSIRATLGVCGILQAAAWSACFLSATLVLGKVQSRAMRMMRHGMISEEQRLSRMEPPSRGRNNLLETTAWKRKNSMQISDKM